MSKVKSCIIFSAGVIIGSAVSWYYAKKRCERIVQEEIDSIKETFKQAGIIKNDDAEPKKNDKRKDVISYENIIKKESYSDANCKKEEKIIDEPYIISPEEFGEMHDYETVSLTYYDDGILADDNDEMVEDVEEVVGVDFFSHFGEYEDDSVFVRNDRLRCDYEILLDHQKYSDVVENNLHLKEER